MWCLTPISCLQDNFFSCSTVTMHRKQTIFFVTRRLLSLTSQPRRRDINSHRQPPLGEVRARTLCHLSGSDLHPRTRGRGRRGCTQHRPSGSIWHRSDSHSTPSSTGPGARPAHRQQMPTMSYTLCSQSLTALLIFHRNEDGTIFQTRARYLS